MANICVCCGQTIKKLNPHRMCKQKVVMLEILAKANDWVHVQEGHGAFHGDSVTRAPYRARAHVSRLVWFGLAEHGVPRSGLYRITQEGRDFLAGTHVVPKVIWCRNGVVVETDSMQVTIGSIKDVVLDKEYWDKYGAIQK
jgi:hypothetical protein